MSSCLNGTNQVEAWSSHFTQIPGFDMEWKHIWKKYWLFAGTTAAIPKPGDYFVYSTNNDSTIIIRGNNGEVYAHYNTCRHRGL